MTPPNLTLQPVTACAWTSPSAGGSERSRWRRPRLWRAGRAPHRMRLPLPVRRGEPGRRGLPGSPVNALPCAWHHRHVKCVWLCCRAPSARLGAHGLSAPAAGDGPGGPRAPRRPGHLGGCWLHLRRPWAPRPLPSALAGWPPSTSWRQVAHRACRRAFTWKLGSLIR